MDSEICRQILQPEVSISITVRKRFDSKSRGYSHTRNSMVDTIPLSSFIHFLSQKNFILARMFYFSDPSLCTVHNEENPQKPEISCLINQLIPGHTHPGVSTIKSANTSTSITSTSRTFCKSVINTYPRLGNGDD